MLKEELLQDALHYGKAFVHMGQTAQYIPELKNVSKKYAKPRRSLLYYPTEEDTQEPPASRPCRM